MKVVLYMAMTVNGMVAKEDEDTNWVTDVEWESFSGMINRVGNMIIGRKTYDVMKEGDQFKGLEKAKVIVVTSGKIEDPNVATASSPAEALKIVEEQGFKEALVSGGGKLNGAFMSEGLVDEVYLDVEPVAFGKGKRLFGDADFEAKLELIETKKLSENEVQLHYRVVK